MFLLFYFCATSCVVRKERRMKQNIRVSKWKSQKNTKKKNVNKMADFCSPHHVSPCIYMYVCIISTHRCSVIRIHVQTVSAEHLTSALLLTCDGIFHFTVILFSGIQYIFLLVLSRQFGVTNAAKKMRIGRWITI